MTSSVRPAQSSYLAHTAHSSHQRHSASNPLLLANFSPLPSQQPVRVRSFPSLGARHIATAATSVSTPIAAVMTSPLQSEQQAQSQQPAEEKENVIDSKQTHHIQPTTSPHIQPAHHLNPLTTTPYAPSTVSTPTHFDSSSSASVASTSSTPSSSLVPHDTDSSSSSFASPLLSDKHELRFLISSSQVGSIIGKGGANVRSVREASGCYVSILKTEYRDVVDRVMEVKGTVEQIPVAVEKLAELLLLAMRERGEVSEEDEAPLVTMVMLLHRGVVGSIIGRGGSIVKETQQASGVRIQVSNEVLAGSSEKTVTIVGTTGGMREAMRRLVQQIAETEEKRSERAGGVPMKVLYYVPTPTSLQHTYPMSSPMYAPLAPSHHKLLIPSSCAGIVIGKGGTTIHSVRAQSGCSISIEDEEDLYGAPTGERVVHIIGSQQGIMIAIFLIRSLLDSVQMPPHMHQHALPPSLQHSYQPMMQQPPTHQHSQPQTILSQMGQLSQLAQLPPQPLGPMAPLMGGAMGTMGTMGTMNGGGGGGMGGMIGGMGGMGGMLGPPGLYH